MNLDALNSLFEANLFVQVIVAAFLAILFLQSGIDKILDWQGNLGWLKGHFSETPLKNMVPMMLGTVLLLEVLAGALSAMGGIAVVFTGDTMVARWGATLAALTLTMLFFGQRIAKDYEGAATLVSYFILAIFAVLLFS